MAFKLAIDLHLIVSVDVGMGCAGWMGLLGNGDNCLLRDNGV
jgi:hypothetical protein